jgi:hypothetical protein
MSEARHYFLQDLDKVRTDPKFIFVILPFQHTLVFDAIIKPEVEKNGFTCHKADDFFRTGAIMNDIAASIKRATLVIADLTGRNANVFYELGLAHALQKEVVLLTQDEKDVPSDLRAYRFYEYATSSSEGIRRLRETISRVFKAIQKGPKPVARRTEIVEVRSEFGNELKIGTEFIKCPAGSLCMWMYVTTEINEYEKHKYPLSHCTNDAKPMVFDALTDDETGQPLEPRKPAYVNVFALRTGPKSNAHPNSVFSFWCSDSSGRYNLLHYRDGLSPGWHLFCVTWSREEDQIKFYVDKKHVGTSAFRCWPDELSPYAFVGTWPNCAALHYVNTKVGELRIFDQALRYEDIAGIHTRGIKEAVMGA